PLGHRAKNKVLPFCATPAGMRKVCRRRPRSNQSGSGKTIGGSLELAAKGCRVAAGSGIERSRKMKAMRGRIALQGTPCEIHRLLVLSFAAAFGVRTRPRVAFVPHR